MCFLQVAPTETASAQRLPCLAGHLHLVESALAASRSTLSIDSPFSAGDDASGGLAEVLGQADDSGVCSTAMEDVTLERVRQIQVRAISKMKTPLLRKAIDPFI